MPRKKVGVKKLRSSKKKSVGMTEISIEKLESVLCMEKQIEELKNQIEHPTYYDLGRPHAYHIPVTDAVKMDMATEDEIFNRIQIMEINNITNFFMITTMVIFITCVLSAWIVWP